MKPKEIAAAQGVKVIDAACGGTHSLLLDNLGNVYSMGRGDHGRLGTGSTVTSEVPRLIDSLTMANLAAADGSDGAAEEGDLAVSQVACGSTFCMVLVSRQKE